MTRKKGAKTINPETCKAIHDISCLGVRNCVIAKYYIVHQSTTSKIISRECNKNKVTKRRTGCKLKLSERSMPLFGNYVTHNCFDSLHVIVAKFNAFTKINISVRTGWQYIRKLNSHSYVALQKPFLSKKNINVRIIWARTHETWIQEKWTRVIFTGESSFSVRPKKNRMQVWRKSGQRMHLKHIVPTFKSEYQTVSFWGEFFLRGRTQLVETVGSFDRHMYRGIIDNHVLPFMYDVHDGLASFVLQEASCGSHRAKSIADYLANEEVARMKWLPQSPDLNPIENLWGLMKTYLRKRAVHPKNPIDLFRILSNIWNTLPDSYFQKLVASMPKCIEMVCENKGGSSKY